jgi:cytochrome c oxidase subunit 2
VSEQAPTRAEETTPESELVANRETHGDALKMFGIGAIASILGVTLALIINWFPVGAAKEAKDIDTLWDVLLIASVPVFVLVEVVVGYCVVRFRMRPGEELKDGPPIHGNTTVEIVWTAIPAILLVALCTYAYVVLTDVEKAQANTMNVRVMGQQFTWTFFYRRDGKEVASPQLYVPIGQPVKFTVQSRDVLHDFWVPGFRVKIDAVPGIDTSIRVTPSRLGTYPVVCAELCGLGHSVMRQDAHVVSRKDFDAWLQKLGQPAPAPGGGGGGGAAAADGKTIFTQIASPACGSCHTLADAGTTATVGPVLDKFLKGKDKAFIRQSIVDPGAQVEKGFQDGIMPTNYGQTLQPDQLDALVDYLSKVTSR